jgi:hypothetical protein
MIPQLRLILATVRVAITCSLGALYLNKILKTGKAVWGD